MSTAPVPTINDLRAKICYICRDEETVDAPEQPQRPWIHPCTCTLIAHESCLLDWIRSSETASAQLAKNALKCPQCGEKYDIESRNPILLRVMTGSKRFVQRCGIVALLGGAAGGAALITGVGIWALTKYGVYATREFLGEEMFQLQLTDDPDNWTTSAFFYLPLIPISLMTSSTRRNGLSSMINVFLCLTTGLRSFPRNGQNLPLSVKPAAGLIDTWPPSPLLVSLIVFPLTRTLYRRAFNRLKERALGTNPVPNAADQGAGDNLLVFRIRADQGVPEEVVVPDDAGPNANPMPGALAVEQAQPAAPGNVNPPGNNNVLNVNPGPVAAPGPAGAAADRNVLEISAASLGRRVLGALLSPTIANRMGRLLFLLSRRSTLLHSFLGIRPKWDGASWPVSMHAATSHQLTLGHFVRAFIGGTGPWPHLDPVWWRNSVGFGVFVVMKDCLSLLHQWLSKREIETRRVKSKDFSGIALDSLDLIEGWADRV